MNAALMSKDTMKTHLTRRLALAGLGLAVAACSVAAQAQHMHASAGKPAAPYVGAAFAPDGALWVLQVDAQDRLILRVSRDEGGSWQPERVLDTAGDRIKSGGESPARLAFGPHGAVVVGYARPLEKKYSAEIRLLRSADGGDSFAPPVTLHRDRQVVSHSYPVMAFDARGALHTVWIDGRDKVAANEAAAKSGRAKADYRGVSLYRNVSLDGGASFGPDIKLSDYSCECCRLAMTPAAGGQLALMWRHVTAPNIRDHAFTILGDNNPAPTSEPVRATFDNWAIDGCPHHGPGLATAAGGGYHAVWFGQRAGVAQVRYGKLDQAGHPVGEVRALPDSKAEHADVLADGSKLAIVWRSFDGEAMNLYAWVSGDDGQHFVLRQLARSTGESDYPRLLSKGKQDGRLFVIWNTTGKLYVEAL